MAINNDAIAFFDAAVKQLEVLRAERRAQGNEEDEAHQLHVLASAPMSLPEQGAKLATSAIDALKSQPIMLAVLIFNVIIFAAILYAVQSNRSAQHEVMKLVLEKCHL